jgi:hypothetical protein
MSKKTYCFKSSKLILMIMVLVFCFTAALVSATEKDNGQMSSKADSHIEKYQFQDSAENEDAPKIPICKDFMANLKALGEPPMVCDRKFHPKFKQFTWPKWEKMNAWENRDLIYQVWEERWKQANDPNYPYAKDLKRALEGSKQYLKQNVDSGNITLSVTSVQSDGKQTDVLQLEENRLYEMCDPTTGPLPNRKYFIFDTLTRKVDFKATEKSIQFGLYGETNIHYGDLFLYNGLPYAAFWDGNSKNGTMVIKGGYNDYCFIEYNSTNKKGEK